MRNKKRESVLTAVAAVLIGLSLCLAACGGDTGKSFREFDVPEDITVSYGASVIPSTLLVFDENGISAEVYVDVTDSNGGLVQLVNGAFTATDAGGYTVRYVAKSVSGYTEEKTQRVFVTGSPLALSAKYDPLVTVGDSVKLNGIGGAGVALSYSVKFGETDVAVAENAFTPTVRGYYDVTVHGVKGDATGEFSYRVYAQSAARVGEIEAFGLDWRVVSGLKGLPAGNWTPVAGETVEIKGEENGLVDPYGYADSFLQFTATSGTEIDFVLSPRHNVEYYKGLANKGYDYVSVWVYLVGEKEHNTKFFVDSSTGTMYNIDGAKVKPNTWTELRMPLHDGVSGNGGGTRSFIGAFPFYERGSTFLRIENHTGATKENCTVYLTDILAVPSQTRSVLIDRSKNETPDWAAFTETEGRNLDYVVNRDGQTVQESALSVGKNAVTVEMYDGETIVDYVPATVEIVDPAAENTLLNAVSNDPAYAYATASGQKTDGLTVVGKDQLSQLNGSLPAGELFYKLELDKSNVEPGLTVLSAFSKEGLNVYRGYGDYGFDLMFDIYIDRAQSEESVSLFSRVVSGGSQSNRVLGNQNNIPQNAWTTVSVSLGDYIDGFGDAASSDSYFGIVLDGKPADRKDTGAVYITSIRLEPREFGYYDDRDLGIIQESHANIDIRDALGITAIARDKLIYDVARRAGNRFVPVAAEISNGTVAPSDYIGGHRVSVSTLSSKGIKTKLATLSFETVGVSETLWQELSADEAFAFGLFGDNGEKQDGMVTVVADPRDASRQCYSLYKDTGRTEPWDNTFITAFKVAPKFSKEALETYYKDCVAEFDVCAYVGRNGDVNIDLFTWEAGKCLSQVKLDNANVSAGQKTWTTARFKISDILQGEFYEKIAEHGNNRWYALFNFGNINIKSGHYIYVSPIRITRLVDKGIVDLAKTPTESLDIAEELGLPAGEYTYKLFDKAGNKLVESANFAPESGKIDPHDYLGYHEIEAYKDSVYCGKLAFEYVDTSATELLWQIMSDKDDYAFAKAGNDSSATATQNWLSLETPDGKSNQYYKIKSPTSKTGYIPMLKVAPRFSKEALELYGQAGYSLQFEFYAVLKGRGDTATYNADLLTYKNGTKKKNIQQCAQGTWYTDSISVSDLLAPEADIDGYALVAEHSKTDDIGRLFNVNTVQNYNADDYIYVRITMVKPAANS